MRKILLYSGVVFIMALMLSCSAKPGSGASKVVLKETNGKYRLYVDGNEFFIEGAGCEYGNIEKLASNGANSFRTWRTSNGKQTGYEILDHAQKCGLKVLMCLELLPERKGFDYNDTAAVNRQYQTLKAEVVAYKNHPALLGWILGNELNLFYKNPKVWDAVGKLTDFIHTEDPNHPVTTALAGISKDVVGEIKKRAPGLDFLSIQMYGDIVNLQTRIKEAQWNGPYVVTEWGATGHWEVPKTQWQAPIEQTSSEKATAFAQRYNMAILADSMKCLGSYVFVWEQKQERTPTWYGMFTEAGDETEVVDVMHHIWTGKWPANSTPKVDSVLLNGKSATDNIHLKPAESFEASIKATDTDTLAYTFEILPESTAQQEGGDKEIKPAVISSCTSVNGKMKLLAPKAEGAYRLFFYVKDGKGHCGTANIPFLVQH